MIDPIDVLDFVLMILAASVPLYIAYRVKGVNKNLLTLAVLLASFTLLHAMYHLSLALGFSFVAYVLFWPVGAILLFVFGLYYWRTGV